MKKFKYLIIACLAFVGVSIYSYASVSTDTCGGKCTGSAYCTACKNCSGCKHCNEGGGTCGVCSSASEPTYTAPKPEYKTTKSNSGNSSSSSTSHKKSVARTYIVKSSILNIRKEASINSKVICTVKKSGKIKILKEHDDNWYLVQALCGGNTIKGFVSKASVN